VRYFIVVLIYIALIIPSINGGEKTGYPYTKEWS
jgi:hypothetical protein